MQWWGLSSMLLRASAWVICREREDRLAIGGRGSAVLALLGMARPTPPTPGAVPIIHLGGHVGQGMKLREVPVGQRFMLMRTDSQHNAMYPVKPG